MGDRWGCEVFLHRCLFGCCGCIPRCCFCSCHSWLDVPASWRWIRRRAMVLLCNEGYGMYCPDWLDRYEAFLLALHSVECCTVASDIVRGERFYTHSYSPIQSTCSCGQNPLYKSTFPSTWTSSQLFHSLGCQYRFRHNTA
jgi:hypothetical protein